MMVPPTGVFQHLMRDLPREKVWQYQELAVAAGKHNNDTKEEEAVKGKVLVQTLEV